MLAAMAVTRLRVVPALLAVALVHVYPNRFGGAPHPQPHFDLVLHDGVAMSPTAQLEWRTPSDLKLGSRTVPGFDAHLVLERAAQGAEGGTTADAR
jgi:hypothetical protein